MNMQEIKTAVEEAREFCSRPIHTLDMGTTNRLKYGCALLALWSMLPRWTREVPKEHGWYWCKDEVGAAIIHYYKDQLGSEVVGVNGSEMGYVISATEFFEDGYMYAGPIPRALDAANVRQKAEGAV